MKISIHVQDIPEDQNKRKHRKALYETFDLGDLKSKKHGSLNGGRPMAQLKTHQKNTEIAAETLQNFVPIPLHKGLQKLEDSCSLFFYVFLGEMGDISNSEVPTQTIK